MPQTLPSVSVIIPTFNRSLLLKETLQSLCRQTYPWDLYEIIVVDNDSTDDTEEMVKAVSSDAPCRIGYFRKEGEGPGKARNFGLARAAGSIIAFTDSDCTADPGWIENAVRRMSPEVGIVQGKTLPKSGIPAGVLCHTQAIGRESGLYEGCNIFYQRGALDQVGGFSPVFIGRRFGRPSIGGEDTDLGWRVRKGGWKTIFAGDAIVFHHVFPMKSLKSIFNFQTLSCFFSAFPKLVKYHPEIRKSLLYRGIFLTRDRALLTLALLSLVPAVVYSPLFLVLAFPFLRNLFLAAFRGVRLKTFPQGLFNLTFLLVNELVTFLLLLSGSIRYRTLVL